MKTKKDFLDTNQLVRSHGYLFFYVSYGIVLYSLSREDKRNSVYIYTSICHLDFNSL